MLATESSTGAVAESGPDLAARPRRLSGLRVVEAPHLCPMGSARVSVVIPTLNEAGNLPHVLERIPRWVHEVLIVDGLSTDGTPQVADEIWQRLNGGVGAPALRVVTQTVPGKGAALRSGFAAAEGDIVVMLDADGSTDPAEIPRYVGALLGGADFAKGSRFLMGGGTSDMPIYRQLGNFGFVLLVRALFGGRYTDLCYGYNAAWRRCMQQLDLDCDGFEVETVMNLRAVARGLKIVEVPSYESPRVHGVGHLRTFPDGWRVLKSVFREWFRARVTSPASTEVMLVGSPNP
ncbi:MAG: glycosyltransferase family 2 protein [Chloroflexota bacterium]